MGRQWHVDRYYKHFQFGVESNYTITNTAWEVLNNYPCYCDGSDWRCSEGRVCYGTSSITWEGGQPYWVGGMDYSGVNTTYTSSDQVCWNYSGRTIGDDELLWSGSGTVSDAVSAPYLMLAADFSADSGIIRAYPDPEVDREVAYPTKGYIKGAFGLGTNTTFNFTDETTGGVPPYTYEWDFDNNGTIDSTLQNPVYTYPDAGTYTVALTVTDVLLDEDTETKEDYLMVYKPGDANSDCEINMADVTKVERIILRLDPPTIWGDVSQDGAINMADVATIEWIIILGLGGYYC